MARTTRLRAGDLRQVTQAVGAAGVVRRRGSSGPVSVHVTMAQGQAGSVKVGFAVSRSVGNAVVRNRVRRRLRTAVPGIVDRMATLGPGGVTLVVVRVSPAGADASSVDLHAHLGRAVDRVVGGRG